MQMHNRLRHTLAPYTGIALQRRILKGLNALLRPLGAQLVRAGQTCAGTNASVEWRDPSSSYMHSPTLRRMLVDELASISRTFFAERLPHINRTGFEFSEEVERFLDLYASRPFADNNGGSGFHNQFWLFLIARAVHPDLIIESGVWRGHTSWLFEQACPQATIHGFDITLEHLERKTQHAHFHQHDWSSYRFADFDPDRALLFFDCHVDHARRLLESSARRFKHLLFDDNAPVHKLYGYRLPAFPTADMLRNGHYKHFSEVSWRCFGTECRYTLDETEAAHAARLIDMHEVFPDVSHLTRYSSSSYSYLTYVRLQQP